MTKEEEIKHLMALMGKGCGDTYFNQFFSICDIEKMIENIHSDFAIEMGCSFNTLAERLGKQLEEERRIHKAEILNFAESILISKDENDNIAKTVAEFVGRENVIKLKHKNNIALSKEEVDFLVSRL